MSEENDDLYIVENFKKFINKMSKVNDKEKLLSFMSEFNLTNDIIISFNSKSSFANFNASKMSIEHCALLSSNGFFVRHLVETGSLLFNQFISASLGFTTIFNHQMTPEFEEKRHRDMINPDNFLINNYTKKSFGSYKTKPISIDFIEAMVESFPKTLNADDFFKIIVSGEEGLDAKIQDKLILLFKDKLTSEGVKCLMNRSGFRHIYLNKDSVSVIEKNIDLYSLKEEDSLSYVLSSPYELGMINSLFKKHDFKDIYEAVFRKLAGNSFTKKDPYVDYKYGDFSNRSRLNSYYLNNNDYDKVKFFVQQFEQSKIESIKYEYNHIIEQSLSSIYDCSKIFELFKNHFPDKKINHFENLKNYFIGDTIRLSDNLKNYITVFNLEDMVLSEKESVSLISSILKSKKITIFNDFLESPLFKNEQLNIILDELGNSLSRKKSTTDVGKKEFSFYSNIVDMLKKNNVQLEKALVKYISKPGLNNSFKAYLEHKLLTESFEQELPKMSVKKKRM